MTANFLAVISCSDRSSNSIKQLYEGEANVWSLHIAQFGAVGRGALPVWRCCTDSLLNGQASLHSLCWHGAIRLQKVPQALVMNTTTELLVQTCWEVGAQLGEAGHCVTVRSTELHGSGRAVEDAAVLSPNRRRTARAFSR